MKHRIVAAAFAAVSLSLAACAAAPEAPAEEAAPPAATAAAPDAALQSVVDGAWRTEAERARDQYRHPAASLAFWGLRPGMTIVEIEPGTGSWWTAILAPYARATGGRYIAGWIDLANPNVSDRARQARAAFETEYADASLYGAVTAVNFGPTSGLAVPDASVDFILVARAFHNWARQDVTDRYMAEFARALKPGGVLAVEQHRAAAGADIAASAPTGYVPESYVIAAAERAGLTLAARSEINANPRDDRDHPFGVWTLPPVARTAPLGEESNPDFDRTEYDAIGESDRMTLRFVKP
ncbi:MAG: methyltransferase domain-containing protein [Alphaproteobacteria bacterium]|nr:methyltransferase domain-containing protein [Alphaproteobacteria bacterium]